MKNVVSYNVECERKTNHGIFLFDLVQILTSILMLKLYYTIFYDMVREIGRSGLYKMTTHIFIV